MADIDLNDYTEAWRCDETSSSAALTGVNGIDIPISSLTVGVGTDGHIDDPAGTTRSRGNTSPIGDAAQQFFETPFVASGPFDIRGQVSCTIAMWFRLSSTNTGGPYGFSIHNPAAANGQALWLLSNHYTLGANPAPAMFMLDGLTAFNFKAIQATDAVSPPEDSATWQFNVGGYDAARNKVFHFWGRGAGERYYAEIDGFAAGFGFTGAAGCDVGFAQFNDGNGTIREQKLDQCMWWKGRALSLQDLDFLWNNHVGRPLNDLRDPIASAAAQNYYYGRP